MEKRPNKESCIHLLYEKLVQGGTYLEIMAQCQKKWHYPKRTFDNHWREVIDRHKITLENKKIILNNIDIKKTIESYENGLDKRLERLIELQGDAKKIQAILDLGITEDSFISNGTPKFYQRPLTENEKEKWIARKQSIIDQIQKMEGDAMPSRSRLEIEDVKREPIKIVFE